MEIWQDILCLGWLGNQPVWPLAAQAFCRFSRSIRCSTLLSHSCGCFCHSLVKPGHFVDEELRSHKISKTCLALSFTSGPLSAAPLSKNHVKTQERFGEYTSRIVRAAPSHKIFINFLKKLVPTYSQIIDNFRSPYHTAGAGHHREGPFCLGCSCRSLRILFH